MVIRSVLKADISETVCQATYVDPTLNPEALTSTESKAVSDLPILESRSIRFEIVPITPRAPDNDQLSAKLCFAAPTNARAKAP
jgi:hypothetical protein